MKQKILYISQLYPYPPTSGGRIKTLHTLRALAREYDVYAVFISEERHAPSDIRALTRLGIRVKLFHSNTVLASVKDDLWGLFLHFLRGVPHYVFQYAHPPAFPFITRLIRSFRPDIIHVDHLNMAQYLPKVKKQIWILEHHNVETYLYWTRFVHTAKPTRKLYLGMELFLTYLYEHRTLRSFDHIFAISRPEEQRLRKIFGVSRVSTQPMVYPPRPVPRASHSGKRILFVGVLGWPPNEDAIEWFVRDMLPDIRKAVPGAQFHIVGQPGPRYVPDKTDGVIVHGFQGDLTPFLSRADVFVLPFRMGGGLRLKALTALSSGLPVVTTPLGVEGLRVQNGKECLVASTKRAFVRQVIQVLRASALRKKLRISALTYIRAAHGMKESAKFLVEYRDVIQQSR